MQQMPLLRLTLQGMQMQLNQALLAQHDELTRIAEAELAKLCTPEYLVAEIRRQVGVALQRRIRDKVDEAAHQATDHLDSMASHVLNEAAHIIDQRYPTPKD